ncbi:hypothetical protein N7448_006249 [Penicillium atrosanguineum]|uniref:Uncharacterized protein n=1 Tax=Penicillium atrosanguineum TaxID=1132637 RepID=A0A9W9GY57_9EURO|nr:uncharacterized protein N7443_010011 [Penicillium atrosanguineum]KAJ5132091.1 hypothetical protein N7448_006249 [Penicillium atrosanguineum]KAJ5137699.1 hypothetical protein N7526_003932 [Penicillium atrosanguineum]KAJ5289758.1 hypothetical protein N7443_010011 [Penicillium atrosanguineum]KAJ5307579.1 hypothetical protein N7476_008235 [Penicillium atrosanguineum]
MQCGTRVFTRNITPTLPSRSRSKLRVVNTTPVKPQPSYNPSPDSDELAYRLCELSLRKMQKEARAHEPDLRHFIACNSMQRLAHQDLLHRLDLLYRAGIQSLPLLPGVEDMSDDDEMWDMRTLELAVSELERASRKGEMARLIFYQQINEM